MAMQLYNVGQVLGVTIINSLWQGLVIYLILRILLLSFPALSPLKKHNILLTGLLGIAAWFAYTFFKQATGYNWSIPTGSISTLSNNPINTQHYLLTDYKQSLYNSSKSYLPYLSVLYLLGLIINLVKLGVAWNNIRIIKKSMRAATILQKQVDDFMQAMVLHKPIQVCFSRFVDVPCVIGYFKPILLLPVTLTTQLSAREVEAILLHELSHIKHNDYLLNLLQQVISVVLFFNPFAYLLGRMIDEEREKSCDDVVVKLTGAPVIYANALLKLEETRQADLKLALAATGKKYQLFSRIERLVKTSAPVVNTRHLTIALLLFIGSVGSISWLNPEIKDGKIVSKNGAVAVHKLNAIVTRIFSGKPEKQLSEPENKPGRNKRAYPLESRSITTLDIDTPGKNKIDSLRLPRVYTISQSNLYSSNTKGIYHSPPNNLYHSSPNDVYHSTSGVNAPTGGLVRGDINAVNSSRGEVVTKTEFYFDKDGNKKSYTSKLYVDRPSANRSQANDIRQHLMSISPWKEELEAIRNEFYSSAAWKKHYDDGVKTLSLWGKNLEGNMEWARKTGEQNDELEHSDAYLKEKEQLKLFNIKLDQEIRRQLAEVNNEKKSP